MTDLKNFKWLTLCQETIPTVDNAKGGPGSRQFIANTTYIAEVPGGWLFRVSNSQNQSVMQFVPKPKEV